LRGGTDGSREFVVVERPPGRVRRLRTTQRGTDWWACAAGVGGVGQEVWLGRIICEHGDGASNALGQTDAWAVTRVGSPEADVLGRMGAWRSEWGPPDRVRADGRSGVHADEGCDSDGVRAGGGGDVELVTGVGVQRGHPRTAKLRKLTGSAVHSALRSHPRWRLRDLLRILVY